jgi:hypothetical protein
VEQDEDLLDRPPREVPGGEHPLAEAVDARGIDRVQQCIGAELGDQVPADRVAAVLERRRPTILLVRHVRQPALACLSERVVMRALTSRVGRLPHRGIQQQLAQRLLGLRRGQMVSIGLAPIRRLPHHCAARRPTPRVAHVRRPEALLVAPVCVAPQRVPDASVRAALDLQVTRRTDFAGAVVRHPPRLGNKIREQKSTHQRED